MTSHTETRGHCALILDPQGLGYHLDRDAALALVWENVRAPLPTPSGFKLPGSAARLQVGESLGSVESDERLASLPRE